MIHPEINYYCRFDDRTGGRTPRYVSAVEWGYYAPMESLRNKDGDIVLYLVPGWPEKGGPAMRLQARDSLNLTGLEGYFGGPDGCASGAPPIGPTYGGKMKKRPNPFAGCKRDGFLFKFTPGDVMLTSETSAPAPACIEMLVVRDGWPFRSDYRMMLARGGFDKVLGKFRIEARHYRPDVPPPGLDSHTACVEEGWTFNGWKM